MSATSASATVITSYSIHYTKLYDHGRGARCDRERGSAAGVSPASASPWAIARYAFPPGTPWTRRRLPVITSYSIHYTKLYDHGRTSASGERYDMNAMTAAHKTLPMPSLVEVTNLENGRTAVLRVNDRGPFVSGHIIDVSRAAARRFVRAASRLQESRRQPRP